MLEDLSDPNFLMSLLVVVSVLAASGFVMQYLSWRKNKKSEESIVATSEWQPTGKIDFYCSEMPKDDVAPASFLLRVEEYRTVESISGVEHTEIRWRKAMLSEAKSVLHVHQNGTDTGTKGQQIPKLVHVSAAATAPQPRASTG
jgi:hypothetical protein